MTLQLDRPLDESGPKGQAQESAMLLANIPGVGQRIHIRLPYAIYLHLAGRPRHETAPGTGGRPRIEPGQFFDTRMSWKFLASTSTGGDDECYFESTSHSGPDGEPIVYGTSRTGLWQ